MAKKLTDEEIMDYTYNKLFGDLDGIQSGAMFGGDKEATQGAVPNAGTPGLGGLEISIKPLMAAATNAEKPKAEEEDDEEEDDDKLKGIGDMSPLMSQLHGKR